MKISKNEKYKQDIISYNEEDCISTYQLREFLVKNKPTNIDWYFKPADNKTENKEPNKYRRKVPNKLSREEVDDIATLCNERGILLISDEIYDEFIYPPITFSSPAVTNEDVIVVRGYSKTYGCTGCRMGYTAGPKQLIQEMLKLKRLMVWNAQDTFSRKEHECVFLQRPLTIWITPA